MLFECGYDGSRSAEGTIRILGSGNFAKFHFKGIINQQVIGKSFADPKDFLYRFIGLENTNCSGEHAQDAGFLAIGHKPCRWGFRVQTAVTWKTLVGFDRGHLPFKPENAARDQSLFGEIAGIIDQKSGPKIVRPIHD